MKSRSFVHILVFLLLVIFPVAIQAGEIRTDQEKTGFQPVSNSYSQFSFQTRISSIQFRDIQTKLGSFTELFVTGYGYSSETGDPKLPVYRKLIELPLNATVEIQITQVIYHDYSLLTQGVTFPVIPQQAAVSKELTDPDLIPFVKNDATYQKNEFLGGPLVRVNPVGMMRSANLTGLEIAPVQYNPVTGTLRVYELIEATLLFKNGNDEATIQLKKNLFSPYFENAYQMLGNYKPVTDELITTAPVTYIIVSDPMFEDALQPFIHWKTRKGFLVVEAYTDDPTVGNTTTSIQSYLQGFYTNPPSGYYPQSFVLFVGDVAQIPAFSGTAGNHPTDLYYCEYTGDKIPECYYGRFSANDLTQLQPQIDKTLEYEQYLFPDESFLDEVVMVAGADASHQMTWGNGQINYGTTYYFNSAHDILSHTYLQPEPSGANYSLQIRTNVSDGVAYANYTAHCGTDGWSDPSFTISHIAALQNAHKYCLMVGNCCLSNKFNGTCFGEEQLRAADKGSLGYIGGSNSTYWDEDFWWGVGFKAISANPVYDPNHLGAYDVTFHDQGEPVDDWFVTQGQMVVGGNMAVQESSTGSSNKTYYWEIYHLMGDPSLMAYLGIPPALTANYPDVLLLGSTSVDIITEPYAYIGLSKNGDTFITAACADSTGAATLTFDALTEPGYLSLVITKQNRKPVIDSIQAIPATGPYLMLASCSVNDSTGGNNDQKADFSETISVNLFVDNIGVMTAANVSATLSTTDTNVTIGNDTFVFDSIPPGGITVGYDAFEIVVNDFIADQHKASFIVLFDDGTDTWEGTMDIILNAPVLAVGAVTILDPVPGGNGNGVLDPGEHVTLRITALNKGHADVGNAFGLLTIEPASAAFVLVTNPNYFIGDITAGGMVYVTYDMETNGITPIGTVIGLNYLETAGSLNQYVLDKSIQLEIGQVPVYTMQTSTQATCAGKFYDSGGPNFNYGLNENMTMTFYPGSSGNAIQIAFTQFELEPSSGCNYDYMNVYNGANILAPLVGKFCGTDIPDSIVSTSPDGALTFQFHSDYSDNYPGWASTLKCVGGPLTLLANAFPSAVCLGNSSRLSAIPGGGSGTYTFLWEPATYLDDPTAQFPVCIPTADITYTVTVNDGSTTLVSEVLVTVKPLPNPATITLNGDILESDVATGNQWFYNGALIPNATQQTYTPVLSGDYYVTITDQTTGCSSEPSNIITYVITGMDQILAGKQVKVYPNPFTQELTIAYELERTSAVSVALIDAFGKIVCPVQDLTQAGAGKHQVTMKSGNLNPGIYYCRILTDTYSIVKKVILTR